MVQKASKIKDNLSIEIQLRDWFSLWTKFQMIFTLIFAQPFSAVMCVCVCADFIISFQWNRLFNNFSISLIKSIFYDHNINIFKRNYFKNKMKKKIEEEELRKRNERLFLRLLLKRVKLSIKPHRNGFEIPFVKMFQQ